MKRDESVDQEERISVTPNDSGERLDRFLAAHLPDRSRSFVQRLIDEGAIQVDRRARKANYRVRVGETITVRFPPPEPNVPSREELPLSVVYEDEALLVVNKPAGIVVHPAPGHGRGTLVNAVLWHSPEIVIGNAERPGIVHRLDRDTSGVIVIAKTDDALRELQRQFASREVRKTYLALVEGRVAVEHGKIDAPLGRDPRDRKKISVASSAGSRVATTTFHVGERLNDQTLLLVEPQTGRTHQIRVHLAFIHHPVVGDTVYGARKNALGLERQFLHAWRLSLKHPVSGQAMEFRAPLAADLKEALVRAGGDPQPWDEASTEY